MTKEGPGDSGPQERPLRQAERYGGPASAGRVSSKRGRRRRDSGSDAAMRGLYVAGATMIGTTLLLGLIGAPPWLSFFAGLAVFVFLILRLRAEAAKTPPRRIDPEAARAAHVDLAKAEGRLAGAEARLRRIETHASALGDPPLARRIRAMTKAARETLDALAADPGDIERAKAFLVVTLPSAEAAMDKYAGLGVRDAALSERFGALMDEVAEAAKAQKARLGRDDLLALEVEMEVLADRLRRS